MRGFMKTGVNETITNWLYPVILIIIPAALLLPSLSFELYRQWDDGFFLLNGHMEFCFKNVIFWLTHPTMTLYTPVTMLSFMFDYSLWGVNPALSRLVNIILHCFSVWLLFRLMLLVGVKRSVAFIFTLAFAVNPQRVGSVVWIAERKDVLCAAAYFGALICFIKACRRDRISVGSLVLLVIALGAKPMAFSLPLLFSVYAFHHYRCFQIRPYLRMLWPCVPITACCYWVFRHFSTKIQPLEFPHNIWVAIHNVCWYTATAVLPVDVCPIYPVIRFSAGTILMITVILILSCSLFYFLWKRSEKKIMLYDIFPYLCGYLFCLIPILGIVSVSNTDYCDRYNYIPAGILLAGLGLVVSKYDIRIRNKQIHRIIIFAIPVYLIYLATVTVFYLPSWRNSYTLFKASMKYEYSNVKSFMGCAEIGLCENRQDYIMEGAKQLFANSSYGSGKTVATDSVQAKTMYNTGLGLLGAGYQRQGITPRGYLFLREFELIHHQQGQIFIYMPELVMKSVYNALAQCYLAKGDRLHAAQALMNVRREMAPQSADHHFYSGVIKYLTGNYSEAMNFFGASLMVNSADEIARHNLMEASEKLNRRLPPDTTAIKLKTNP